jgi:hypothetical protein
MRTGLRWGSLMIAMGVALALPTAGQAAGTGLDAYEVSGLDGESLETLAVSGFDTTEGRDGDTLEIVATRDQAAALQKQGVTVAIKRDAQGRSAARALQRSMKPNGSYNVYRPYFDNTCDQDSCYVGRRKNGNPRPTLYEELTKLAEDNPEIVQQVEIGRTVNDVPILALRVTRDAQDPSNPAGSKPSVLYSSAQHAREWITPEMNRRLAHLFVDNYGRGGRARGTDGKPVAGADGFVRSAELTRLVNRYELWFVVVANPDGYDFTFTPGNRLWRKNLRDNNNDGEITAVDGVDPNRNFAEKWNYDEEGSSGDPTSETYRGTGPSSEPETQAMDGLLADVGFEFQVNYHSAAELLLYPFGFQVQTTAADDPIFEALSGTDRDPAIEGNAPRVPNDYDPDVGAELYITNGETTDHAYSRYDTLAWTPEMDVSDPDRGGGESVFEFQDSEGDLQAAFEKNIPFALDVAASSGDPANPVSHLNRKTPDFDVDRFPTSFGDPQPVETIVKRELGDVNIHWRVNGGPRESAPAPEYDGGERYDETGDVYYRRARGEVTGATAGDEVRVWFKAGGKRSQAFTYEVRSDTGAPVLVLAAEDYTGTTASPAYRNTRGPFFNDYYEDALTDLGIDYDLYDVDAEARKAPDELGILSHYSAVIWYTGNDLLTRSPGQPAGTGVARLANDMILSVRDYINDGGKLLHTGQYAGVQAINAFPFNVRGEPPFCPPEGTARAADCIPLSDDFLQYYLGAFRHIDVAGVPFDGPDPDAASALDLQLSGGQFGNTEFGLNGNDSAENQEHVSSLLTTSSVLPADEYPLFASEQAVEVDGRPASFDPVSGQFYAVAESDDEGWQRLRRTIDLTDDQSGNVSFQISYDTEALYDYVIVEARTVGQNDWTTLPDLNGNTTTDPGEACLIDWQSIHPFVKRYQTYNPKTKKCSSTGTTGEWNGATGSSGGYQEWSIDLSDYAGSQVEISISYVQDFAVSNLGVFLDDVVVTEDSDETTIDFESDLGGFTAGPPPNGSGPGTQRMWERSESLGFVDGPGVATEDSVYWGFGFEGVTDRATRAEVLGDTLSYLGVGN